jgi:hypothetical protein
MKDRPSDRRPSHEPGRRPRRLFAWTTDEAGLPEFDWIIPIRFGRDIRPQGQEEARPRSFPGRPYGSY